MINSIKPKSGLRLVFLLCLFVLPAAPIFYAPDLANTGAEALAEKVTIYRDTFGVPHVYGQTDAAAVFGRFR